MSLSNYQLHPNGTSIISRFDLYAAETHIVTVLLVYYPAHMASSQQAILKQAVFTGALNF